MARLRIVFMGTPELAAESLRALLACPQWEMAAVVTQPDQPKGRGLKLQASPVKEVALQRNLPILQPVRARDEAFMGALRTHRPDLMAVAAYGQILPQAVLQLAPLGCLNIHTSLLPKYRGAAPIQHAILNGETETGVTIMKMDPGMDTGDILAQEKTPILPDDTSHTLHDRLALLGAKLLVETIPAYADGTLKPRPQPAENVSYAPKIKKQDGQINWSEPAAAIRNRIRAMTPWPGAFTHLPASPQPVLLKIWEADSVEDAGNAGRILHADKDGIVVGCGAGALRIRVMQREGGRRMSAHEFLAGHTLRAGDQLV